MRDRLWGPHLSPLSCTGSIRIEPNKPKTFLPTITREELVDETAENRFCVNHSDCDGHYLPTNFDKPICNEDLSVGSSVQLLKELREIERQWIVDGLALHKDKGLQYVWDCLYLAALASVSCKRTIYFE